MSLLKNSKKTNQLNGKRIAILACDGFEQSELFEPKKALEDAGAEVEVVSLSPGKIYAWKDGDWGKRIAVDEILGKVTCDDFDALMLPGGVINADKIRGDKAAVRFVQDFVEAGKPIAAICHAPWVLIEAGAVDQRAVTSWPSLKTDLENAGARWNDVAVVTDQGLVTSRKPDDIPAFNEKMIEEFAEGPHSPRSAVKAQAMERETRIQ